MTQTANVPTLTLNTGAGIPQLGYGVFQVDPDETVSPVLTALEAGYRSIDTAAAYRNEEGVGQAIREAGVPRDELFVTTKLWNSDQGFEPALKAFDQSLERLGLDHVDLYLIHWPMPKVDRFMDSWKALEQLHADGRRTLSGEYLAAGLRHPGGYAPLEQLTASMDEPAGTPPPSRVPSRPPTDGSVRGRRRRRG